MAVEAPYVSFEGAEPFWKFSREGDITYLDLIIYEGEKRPFDLSRMEEAGFALGFSLRKDPQSTEKVNIQTNGRKLRLTWLGMKLSTPLKPALEKELQRTVISNEVL
jgi:hypothetical protein